MTRCRPRPIACYFYNENRLVLDSVILSQYTHVKDTDNIFLTVALASGRVKANKVLVVYDRNKSMPSVHKKGWRNPE